MEGPVSTVFIGGFPPDATERELDNLGRFLPGFVDAKLDTKRGASLFVLFDTPQQAHAAIAALHGRALDRKRPGVDVLRAVLARSNMRADLNLPPALPAPAAARGPPAGSWRPPPPPVVPPVLLRPQRRVSVEADRRPVEIANPLGVDTVACVNAASATMDEGALQGFFEAQPGFVAFKAGKMGGGFSKFETPQLAVAAVAAAVRAGVPAELARSSMSGGTTTGTTTHHRAASAAAARAASCSLVKAEELHQAEEGALAGGKIRGRVVLSGKRPREEAGSVDTVASVGALDAGFDAAALEQFFEVLPGFVAFKANPKMGGGFAKFESPELAVEAVSHAQEAGVPAEMAKSSMGGTGGTWLPGGAPAALPQLRPLSTYVDVTGDRSLLADGSAPPAKRPRVKEDPGQVDTLACVGAADQGYGAEELEAFFGAIAGFVAFKASVRMGGGFVKFASHDLARQAMVIANNQGVPASIARSSMCAV